MQLCSFETVFICKTIEKHHQISWNNSQSNSTQTLKRSQSIRRFIRKPDKARMTTDNVDVQERTMLGTALANGLFVNQLVFRPTEYIEKTDIHATRCFECQKFDHIASFCKLDQKCGKSAENPNTDSCHQSEQNYKSVNCLEQHSSASKECPLYLKTLEKLHQSRSVPLPKQLQDKIDRLTTENKWSA